MSLLSPSKLFFIVLCFFLPLSASAGVSITEVMYDPSGSDSVGSHVRDWVEIYNDGAPIDLSGWKLFEGGTNHGLTVSAGSAVLGTGGYAIVADDPSLFFADFPNFAGVVFDTAFSSGLNSTGETVTLRNADLIDQDSIIYDPSLGGGGDGNSLQKVGSVWVAANPTPGSAAGSSNGSQNQDPDTNPPSNQSSSASATSTAESSGASYMVEPTMSVSAGADRTVTVGAGSVFDARAFGLKGEPIDGARYVWSFGNGDHKEGQSVLYVFSYPGKYVVVVDASSGKYAASDRIVVTAVPADVAIGAVTPAYIEIINRSSRELDLGLWQLTAQGVTFVFPRNTIVLGHESIAVSNAATGLSPTTPSSVTLSYPNGMLAGAAQPTLIVSRNSMPSPLSAGTGSVSTALPKATSGATLNAMSSRNLPSVETVGKTDAIEGNGEGGETVLAASVMGIPHETTTNSVWPWIVGLVAIISVGLAAFFGLHPKKSESGYTIIEDKS